ncbi:MULTISPECIES: LysE/ArgO family amino acid transporter [Alphaproteobacteria]|uniref:Amino acid transporter n=2 Tax=Alphaproteobacteria TaxID=28211 RepID=A0A512HEI0_9HYPH|nr:MULTISPECIES: LysE/ArgO family amino acid transporter [Alphaproteobacteria]GEO83866.1 amino acid transporter [Ciceribacter naphthalenivorans]GLR21256.1 amino acid transporter [Ciceribacter naphthalenivorans]GLT04112.1 amino acid transporter [Sphingomonas psychrolutea]
MLIATTSGFFLGLSLIVAIGAQNAFVLRQGLRRSHVFAICLTCAASDAALISAGIGGLARTIATVPWLIPLLRYGGAAFLAYYGLRSLRTALTGNASLKPEGEAEDSLATALLTCLALTWLNPHVYLDTVVLLGSISTQYPGQGLAFGLGAAAASVLFFFSLGYGARYLRPIFAKPAAWRLLDGLIALVMGSIAVNLVWTG